MASGLVGNKVSVMPMPFILVGRLQIMALVRVGGSHWRSRRFQCLVY